MKIRHALSLIVCLGLCSVYASAADAPATQPSLTIPITVANRAPGAITCAVTVGPTVPVVALAFSPDGKTLAVGGHREVLLWDLAEAKLARRLPIDGYVGSLAYLKEGQTLVVGEGMPCQSGAVRLLDLSDKDACKEICRFSEPKDVLSTLALSPDGKLLAGSGSSKVAYVWDVENKKLATTIHGHADRILHVSFSPDGKYLVTAGDDDTAQVWSVADWSAVMKFTEPYPVRGAAVSPDDTQVLLAVGGPDGSGLRLRKFDNPMYRNPRSIGVAIPLGMIEPSKSGRVYVACTDNTVKGFDMQKNGNQISTFTGHQDWVQVVAVSADEKLIASGSADGSVKLWTADTARMLATLMQLSPNADRWLMMTAQGYFAASSPVALTWKADLLKTPADELTDKMQKPELVAKTIAGEKVPALVVK